MAAKLVKMTRWKRWVNRILSAISPRHKLHRYEYSANMPFGVIGMYTEDELIGCSHAKDQILKIADILNMPLIRYWAAPIYHGPKSEKLFNTIYPEHDYPYKHKDHTISMESMWSTFSKDIFCYRYFLYFESEEDMTAFQIVR